MAVPTTREAIDHLGADHVRWLTENWTIRMAHAKNGAWFANKTHSYSCYYVLDLLSADVVAGFLPASRTGLFPGGV